MRAIPVRSSWRVLAVAICLVVFAAVGIARAEGEWEVAGRTLAELKLKEEKLTVANKSLTLSVPGIGVTISCGEGSASGKLFEGGGDELATSFSKCEVAKLAACKVTEPVTMEAKTVPLAAGGSFYEKLEALKAEKPLMTVFVKGKECSLAEENKVEGAIAGEVTLTEQKEQPLSFSEALSKTVNEKLKADGKAELKLSFGKQTAYLGMKPVLSLAGANSGAEWQRAENTRLCDSEAEIAQDRCPAGKDLPSGTTLKAVNRTEPRFFYEVSGNPVSVPCNVSKLTGTTSAAVGAPLPGTFSAFEFLQCASGACPVAAVGTPFQFHLEVSGPGSGNLTIASPSFKIVCASKTCVYGAADIQFSFVGGPIIPPAWSARGPKQLSSQMGSDMACSATGWLEGVVGAGGLLEYRWTEPLPVFLTN
jgi:hypothetical protein